MKKLDLSRSDWFLGLASSAQDPIQNLERDTPDVAVQAPWRQLPGNGHAVVMAAAPVAAVS
jgi:hypothetical protein